MTNVVNASFLLTLKHFYFIFFFARKDPAATASGLTRLSLKSASSSVFLPCMVRNDV